MSIEGAAAGDFDAFDAATQASAGFVERLAVFGGDDARNLVEVFVRAVA